MDLKSILLLGGSIALCFIAFIIYDFFLAFSLQDRFREFARGDPRYAIHNVHVRDDRYGWKLKSGSRGSHRHPDFDVTYEIDQNGFKKVDNTEHPDFSIWFFGDSFTFGAGVENKGTYANVLKDRYLKKDVNVYNTGVPGYGIVQMFMCFQDVVDKIRRGDVVVLAPISNDIVRHPYQPGTLFLFTVLGDIPIETFPYFENGVIKYDKRRSKLWTKLKVAHFMAPYTGTFWSSTYGRSLVSRSVRDSLAMMEIIKERTEMKGARFVLLFLPTMAECKERNYEVDVSRFSYYDVLRFFPSKEEEVTTLFFPTDRHYNPAGHALAAKAIVQTLVENKIIDKKYLRVPLQR